MQFLYRLHNAGSDKVLAICDAEVLGKTFEENDMHIIVSDEFYSGKSCSEKAAMYLIKSSTIINAVGNNIISIMIKNKVVEKENVLYIGGVPHAQAVSVG